MIPVLYPSVFSRLMALPGSLAERQSGAGSISKEKPCQNSPVVRLLLHPVSSVSPTGLLQPHETRRAPRLTGRAEGEGAKGLEMTYPSHIFKQE